MRILHSNLSGEFAGAERYTAELAAAQAAAGHEVRVLLEHNQMIERWRKEAGKAEVWMMPKWTPRWAQTWVAGHYMRGFEPDVVHAHLGGANKRVGKAAKRLGIPWVATIHLRWKAKEMAAADGVVCIGAWQKAEIDKSYAGGSKVVWNWTRAKGEKPGKSAENLRKAWGCDKGTVVFGSVGRLHPQKGMDVLVTAFKKAFSEDENVRLVLVGDGKKREEIEALVGGDSRIVLTGYHAEVAEYYQAFDVYVSAARHEPFGLTILEAMAASKPLICTRTEGPLEFLKGKPVRWAEIEDVETLARALVDSYARGRRLEKHDMAPFKEARAVKEIVDFYKEIKKKHG